MRGIEPGPRSLQEIGAPTRLSHILHPVAAPSSSEAEQERVSGDTPGGLHADMCHGARKFHDVLSICPGQSGCGLWRGHCCGRGGGCILLTHHARAVRRSMRTVRARGYRRHVPRCLSEARGPGVATSDDRLSRGRSTDRIRGSYHALGKDRLPRPRAMVDIMAGRVEFRRRAAAALGAAHVVLVGRNHRLVRRGVRLRAPAGGPGVARECETGPSSVCGGLVGLGRGVQPSGLPRRGAGGRRGRGNAGGARVDSRLQLPSPDPGDVPQPADQQEASLPRRRAHGGGRCGHNGPGYRGAGRRADRECRDCGGGQLLVSSG
mmetsp:Transcript_2940/g.5604  ORF Transcript_2940/g.5604 Transcript_2940/m.5604 type:complete len:320 (+) Transcript_2940:192-1151(+)